jgi:hypothetical protein
MKPPRPYHVGRADAAVRCTEVHNMAHFIHRPTCDGLRQSPDWLDHEIAATIAQLLRIYKAANVRFWPVHGAHVRRTVITARNALSAIAWCFGRDFFTGLQIDCVAARDVATMRA